MTALTTAQLDAIEHAARCVTDQTGVMRAGAAASLGSRAHEIIRLVAIARAALAWSEVRIAADGDGRSCPDERIEETRAAAALLVATRGAP